MPQTHHLPPPAALHALQSGGVEAWYQQQLAEFVQTQGYHFSYRTFQDRTDRAKAPLVTAADLVAYNACYAASHIARFRCLLDHFVDCQQLSPSIRVVDYGCGQGLASLVLLEYLQDYPQSLQIELHLIEPSALALQHATAYVQHHPAAQCHQITVGGASRPRLISCRCQARPPSRPFICFPMCWILPICVVLICAIGQQPHSSMQGSIFVWG
jgi:hypothetical protein